MCGRAHVSDQHPDEHGHRPRHRIAGPLEQRLARGQGGRKIPPAPRIGEL